MMRHVAHGPLGNRQRCQPELTLSTGGAIGTTARLLGTRACSQHASVGAGAKLAMGVRQKGQAGTLLACPAAHSWRAQAAHSVCPHAGATCAPSSQQMLHSPPPAAAPPHPGPASSPPLLARAVHAPAGAPCRASLPGRPGDSPPSAQSAAAASIASVTLAARRIALGVRSETVQPGSPKLAPAPPAPPADTKQCTSKSTDALREQRRLRTAARLSAAASAFAPAAGGGAAGRTRRDARRLAARRRRARRRAGGAAVAGRAGKGRRGARSGGPGGLGVAGGRAGPGLRLRQVAQQQAAVRGGCQAREARHALAAVVRQQRLRRAAGLQHLPPNAG